MGVAVSGDALRRLAVVSRHDWADKEWYERYLFEFFLIFMTHEFVKSIQYTFPTCLGKYIKKEF